MEHDSSKSLQKKNMRNYRAIGELMIYYDGDLNYQCIRLAYAKNVANVQKVCGKFNGMSDVYAR